MEIEKEVNILKDAITETKLKLDRITRGFNREDEERLIRNMWEKIKRPTDELLDEAEDLQDPRIPPIWSNVLSIAMALQEVIEKNHEFEQNTTKELEEINHRIKKIEDLMIDEKIKAITKKLETLENLEKKLQVKIGENKKKLYRVGSDCSINSINIKKNSSALGLVNQRAERNFEKLYSARTGWSMCGKCGCLFNRDQGDNKPCSAGTPQYPNHSRWSPYSEYSVLYELDLKDDKKTPEKNEEELDNETEI